MSEPDEFWIEPAVAERLLQRISDRIRDGVGPPALSASECKADFPKLLCLDLNKWIDLARAHYGIPEGLPFRAALESVQRAVEKGRLLVPVTSANALETMGPNDEDRRRRLASFMVELSRNHSLVADTEVMVPEMRAAFLRVFGGQEPTSPIRSRLVQWGMSAAIAGRKPLLDLGDPQLNVLMEQTLHEPEVSVEALVCTLGRERVAEFRRVDEETTRVVASIRQIDAHLTIEERRQRELTNLFREGAVAKQLKSIFTGLPVDEAPFYTWLFSEDNAVRFGDAVPGIDVMATLMLRRDRNADHATHKNDGRDYSFLNIAIPYGNVVVTERSWAHLANSSGLCSKYDAVVLAKATQLPDVLASQGCL